MGLKSKLKNFFMLDDEYEEYVEEEAASYEQENEHPPKRSQSRQNVVSLKSVQKNSKVIISEPKRFSEAPDIADHIKNRKAVIVNLQKIDPNEGRRMNWKCFRQYFWCGTRRYEVVIGWELFLIF